MQQFMYDWILTVHSQYFFDILFKKNSQGLAKVCSCVVFRSSWYLGDEVKVLIYPNEIACSMKLDCWYIVSQLWTSSYKVEIRNLSYMKILQLLSVLSVQNAFIESSMKIWKYWELTNFMVKFFEKEAKVPFLKMYQFILLNDWFFFFNPFLTHFCLNLVNFHLVLWAVSFSQFHHFSLKVVYGSGRNG